MKSRPMEGQVPNNDEVYRLGTGIHRSWGAAEERVKDFGSQFSHYGFLRDRVSGHQMTWLLGICVTESDIFFLAATICGYEGLGLLALGGEVVSNPALDEKCWLSERPNYFGAVKKNCGNFT
ncbi:hypothetical protein CU098_009748 [Rhizopus stolonifer]|uniref:Uncharacterized protein n=1 Tax=Rhizopus stolonifer TaxID=4846 RepID=A0A367JV83_RHIST|nr:hypothetical protein CU098_009748 [Rhizopus stolonifer]